MSILRGGLINVQTAGTSSSSAGGVTSIEGLSGIVDLDSPNGSITITTSGQIIQLNALFTPASGAVLEQKCRDIDTLSGLIGSSSAGVTSIEGLSGVVDLDSLNNGLTITTSGQVIQFNTLFSSLSGDIIDQKCQDIVTLSGITDGLPRTQTTINGLSGQVNLVSANSGALNITQVGQTLTLTTNIVSDAGQTSVEGLSGVIDLDSPNSSIAITTAGQTINLEAIFTWASGELLEALVTGSGVRSINGISGIVDLVSENNGLTVTNDGQVIRLTALYTGASGSIVDQKCADILTLSGLIDAINTDTQTTINGISGQVFVSGVNNEVTVSGQTVIVSGHMNAASGAVLAQKCTDIDTLSGLINSIVPDAGQTSINGLSGVITINSANSGAINIIQDGQTLTLSGLYTPLSGAVIDQKCQDLIDLSGLINNIISDGGQTSINGISGIIFVSGVNNEVTVSGQTIIVSGVMNATSGAIIDQKCADILTLSGLINGIVPDAGQTSINGLSGTLGLISPDLSINIANSGTTGIEITVPNSGAPSGASYLLREYDDNDHLTRARVLSATSGVRVSDQGARSASGVVITFDVDNEPTVNQVLKWNGINLTWSDDNTGGGGGGPTTIVNGLSGTIEVSGINLEVTTSGQTILVSGIMNATSGAIIDQKCADILTLSGLVDSIVPDAGQTSINGLSGQVNIVSANSGALNITQVGQILTLTSLFTPLSGANIDACRDTEYLLRSYESPVCHANARILNATSGIRLDDQGARSTSGLVVTLDFDDEPQPNQVLVWTGTKLGWVTTATADTQTSINGLSGAINLVSTNSGAIDIIQDGQTLTLSGLYTPLSGAVVDQKCADIVTLSGLLNTVFRPVDARAVSGNIIPDTDKAYLLGSLTNCWEATATDTLYVNNIIPKASDRMQVSGHLVPSGEHFELGRSVDERWALLNAASGIFTDTLTSNDAFFTDLLVTLTAAFNFRPTVGGVDVALVTDLISTQTSVNGLSGQINLLSANSGAIDIIQNGQTLTLSGLYTPASGALMDSLPRTSGVASLNTERGHVTMNSPDGSISIEAQGDGTIEFTLVGPARLAERTFTQSSGTQFVLEHGLNTTTWVWSAWKTDITPEEILIPDNVYPSGTNHAVVEFIPTGEGEPPPGVNGRIVFMGQ